MYKITDIFYNPPIDMDIITVEQLKEKADDMAQIIWESNLNFTKPAFSIDKPNEMINFLLKYGKYKVVEIKK